jgi:hypothetical protein
MWWIELLSYVLESYIPPLPNPIPKEKRQAES